MSMIQRRMWGGGSQYLNLVRSYGTLLAYWPLDDYDTQTTTIGSINETEGGSDGARDHLINDGGTLSESTVAINNVHGSSSLYGTDTPSVDLIQGAVGNLNTTGLQNVWIAGWMEQAVVHATGNAAEVLTLASSSSNIWISTGGGWHMDVVTSGPIHIQSTVPGATGPATPHLVVFTQIWDGANYDHYGWVGTEGASGLVASSLNRPTPAYATSPFVLEMKGVAVGVGRAEWRYSAFSVSSGVGPTTAGEVAALYEAGKL